LFKYKGVLCVLLAGAITAPTALPQDDRGEDDGGRKIKHVLLLSIDGMHAVDYLNCANGIGGSSGPNGGAPYCPNLAALGTTGINYRNAATSKPSDSFPGLTAIVSGGTPRSFGIYYDVAYDRVLAPPVNDTGNGLKGGNCTAGQPNGTRTEYEEGIDLNQSLLNGGAPGAAPTDGGIASIDSTRLIRDPYKNCNPVYPWNFTRTNTIFGVIHNNGGYTAWSDKHPAYSSVSGPGNGSNVDDFYGPEINSDTTLASNQAAVKTIVPPVGGSCATIDGSGDWTTSFHDIRCYDTLKVNAVLNEIAGKNHLGTAKTKRPTILGMNFQAVSVGQKLIFNGMKGGYLDAQGTTSAELLTEIEFVDAAIGEMVSALESNGILDSTLIVITAKHGQSPIDTNLFYPVPGHNKDHGTTPASLLGSAYLPDSEVNQIGPTEDDVSLLWLKSTSQTQAAVDALEASSKIPGDASYIGLGQIYYGQSLRSMIDIPGIPPSGDPRTPDIIVTPNVGIIYTGSLAKQAEHGGFAHDDTNVILLLSNPNFSAKTVTSDVQTAQVAPTILKALGLDPNALQAVQLEGTPVLPAVQFGSHNHE
jgi:Type I phosphodiesterase / nucleotide pyrophosphatase